jgi:two-component system, sporulation sensor kinase A
MSFLAITGLVNFITSILFGFFVLIKNPRVTINRSVFFISMSIAIYGMGYFFWQMSHDPSIALIWFKILCTGIILINVAFLQYVFLLTGLYEKKKKELIAYYAINAIFLVLNALSLLYTHLEPRYGLGWWPSPTIIFPVYLILWLLECFYGFILLLRSLGTATGIKKEQIKYTIVSAVIGFMGGASNWPMWYELHFPPHANILVATYIGLMGYAIVRYRLMDIKVILSKTGIFLSVYTVVLGIPFIIGVYSGFGFFSFTALFILATAGPIINRYLQGKAENLIMARQRAYQQILHESVVTILRVHNIERLIKLIMYGMNRIIKVDFAAIFLDLPDDECLKLMASTNYNVFHEDMCISYNDPAVELMKKNMKPLAHEKVNRLFPNAAQQEISMLIPSFIDDRLMGFLVMGNKMDGSLYSPDDMDTFDIISHQTALAIENCQFIEERKKTQERLFQAEKLALVGGMAEGVAHQIRNRLNHFSLATMHMRLEIDDFKKGHADLMKQNPDIMDTFDSLNEIGESVIENVKKTNSVIQGILNFTFSDDKNTYFSGVALREILDGAIDLVRIKHGIEDIPISIEIDDTEMIYGIMTQLMESLFNIIDNAYEATNEKMKSHMTQEERRVYNPLIQVRVTRDSDLTLIEITDNGVGIANEDKKKIFAPYFTTKSSYKSKSSSGIGLYIVHRMITENHKGKIWFTSEFMKGSSFFISLPIKNVERELESAES